MNRNPGEEERSGRCDMHPYTRGRRQQPVLATPENPVFVSGRSSGLPSISPTLPVQAQWLCRFVWLTAAGAAPEWQGMAPSVTGFPFHPVTC